MATKGQAVVQIAEGELGTAENPDGSNLGPPEKYQRVYGWPIGQPWCGCFTGWALEQHTPGAKSFSDPGTAVICSSKPKTSPKPGAMIVDCGTHVTMLRYQISGSSWACVGGNEGNAVRFSTRNISGWSVHGPAWLGDGSAPPPEQKTTWYFLQDVGAARIAGQRMYYGGWSSQATRDEIYEDLKDDLGHEIRKFKDPDFDGAFLLDNSAFCDEIYGGWSSKASRDSSRQTLEERLGRTLRPFSEERTAAQGGVPWNCRNLEEP